MLQGPHWTHLKQEFLQRTKSESESHVTTDGRSASLSWNKAPIWGLRPELHYCQDSCGFVDLGYRKRRLQQFFFAAGTSLPSCYVATIKGHKDTPSDSPLTRHEPQRKWRIQQFFYFCVLFVVAGTCLPRRWLATLGWTHIERHRLKGRIYEVRRSDGLICRDIHTAFHKDCFWHSKVYEKGYTDT
jgi:hypothetical protein